MKFAEHLTAHITPEWRKQYINYEVSALNFLATGCKILRKSYLSTKDFPR